MRNPKIESNKFVQSFSKNSQNLFNYLIADKFHKGVNNASFAYFAS